MRYILDTDTLIDYLQNRGQTRRLVGEMISAGDELALCAITVAELHSGLSERKRKEWHEFLSALPYWDVSREAAAQAGVDRKAASESGHTLPVTDTLIAAVAREHAAIVLTSNAKDFPMKDVRVVSLREKVA